jgi:hypothetical protein
VETDLVVSFRGAKRRAKSPISNNPNGRSLAPRSPKGSPRTIPTKQNALVKLSQSKTSFHLILNVGRRENAIQKTQVVHYTNFDRIIKLPNYSLHIMASYVKNIALVGVRSENKK